MRIAILCLATCVTLSGCSAIQDAIGPTCSDYLQADEVGKQEMTLEWMKDKGLAPEEAAMTDAGSQGSLLGFEVMAWVDQMKKKCGEDESTFLNSLDPG